MLLHQLEVALPAHCSVQSIGGVDLLAVDCVRKLPVLLRALVPSCGAKAIRAAVSSASGALKPELLCGDIASVDIVPLALHFCGVTIGMDAWGRIRDSAAAVLSSAHQSAIVLADEGKGQQLVGSAGQHGKRMRMTEEQYSRMPKGVLVEHVLAKASVSTA
jgi:hypothetical protein